MPIRSSNFFFLMACLALVVLLNGCMEFGRLDYTRPSNLAPDDFGPWYTFNYPEVFPLALNHTNVEISVATSADSTTFLFCPFPCPLPVIPWLPGIISSWFYSPDYEPDQRLSIEIWIVPKGRPISFDVQEIKVRISDDKRFGPAALDGPAILKERVANQVADNAYLHHSCSFPLLLGSRAIVGPVPDREIIIEKPVCMRVGFRVSVTPTAPYFLQIDGISEDGVLLSIPPMKFDRVSRKRIWKIW